MDRNSTVAPARGTLNEMHRFIDALGKEWALEDGWRTQHPNSIVYSFYRGTRGVSRINRIHIRADIMSQIAGWDIRASRLETDYHATIVTLKLLADVLRGRGR